MSEDTQPEAEAARIDAALREVVDTIIAPLLQRDGAALTWLRREGEVVELRPEGSLHGCPGRAWTIDQVVLPALRRAHPAVRSVRLR